MFSCSWHRIAPPDPTGQPSPSIETMNLCHVVPDCFEGRPWFTCGAVGPTDCAFKTFNISFRTGSPQSLYLHTPHFANTFPRPCRSRGCHYRYLSPRQFARSKFLGLKIVIAELHVGRTLAIRDVMAGLHMPSKPSKAFGAKVPRACRAPKARAVAVNSGYSHAPPVTG